MLQFTQLNELITWLHTQGINPAAWETANGKRVENLWQEWLQGEFEFQGTPPMRYIQVLQLIIRREEFVLIEAEQELGDGSRRTRGLPPSEKIKRGETYLEAAMRCCYEEIGVSAQAVQLLSESYRQWEETAESPSYPGLPTHYTFHSLQAIITGLPAEDFWRDNHAFAQGDPVKRHRWGWRKMANHR